MKNKITKWDLFLEKLLICFAGFLLGISTGLLYYDDIIHLRDTLFMIAMLLVMLVAILGARNNKLLERTLRSKK